MSKKHCINEEALEKVNGGYVEDGLGYIWLSSPDEHGCRKLSYYPQEGWEKILNTGSIVFRKMGKKT